MNGRYFVKPKAGCDLDDCADYLATHASLDVALRFIDAAHATFAAMASQPGQGWRCRLRRADAAAVRVFRVKGFESMLVFYRPRPNGVEILRVLHGSRNLSALLRRQGFE